MEENCTYSKFYRVVVKRKFLPYIMMELVTKTIFQCMNFYNFLHPIARHKSIFGKNQPSIVHETLHFNMKPNEFFVLRNFKLPIFYRY